MKKAKKKYNYKPITILFDLDLLDEKVMVEWLETHKGKKNGFSVQLKKALKTAIDHEKAQMEFAASQGWKKGER